MADFRIFRQSKGVDEVLFGEIVRIFTKKNYPMIKLRSSEDFHHARFLMQGTPLFTVDVKMKRYSKKVFLKRLSEVPMRVDIEGTAIVKGSSFDKLVDLYKGSLTNVFKFPTLGMIKVDHNNNKVFLKASMIGLSKKYFDADGDVDRDRLTEDVQDALDEMMKSMDKFISHEKDAYYVDQAVDVEKELERMESDMMLKIQIIKMVPVVCPECECQFETKAKGAICCPECGLEGELE